MYSLSETPTLRRSNTISRVAFSIIGPAAAQVYTQRKYFGVRTTIKYITVSAGTPPSGGALTVQLKKNGTNLGSAVTIVNGAYFVYSKQKLAIAAGEYITVELTAVNSAEDINIELLVS